MRRNANSSLSPLPIERAQSERSVYALLLALAVLFQARPPMVDAFRLFDGKIAAHDDGMA